jgi:hypothetical protein
MAQIFLFLTLALSTLTAWAAETITIMSPYSASHSGTPAPFVFNITVAHVGMYQPKRLQLSKILNTATLAVGAQEIFRLSDMTPPVFDRRTVQDYYRIRFDYMDRMLQKHQSIINDR